jgi:TRAP-type mannitol/chloroaromatic compound transport system substrate-binding protein
MRIVAGLTTAAMAASLLALQTPAEAAEKVTWNFSAWGNPRPFTVGIETLAKYVSEKSGGNFEITIHYAETISPARNNLDTVSVGAAESAHVCASYHPGKNPVSTVLDLPFLPIDGVLHLQHVHEAFAQNEHHVAELKGWNARFMLSGVARSVRS